MICMVCLPWGRCRSSPRIKCHRFLCHGFLKMSWVPYPSFSSFSWGDVSWLTVYLWLIFIIGIFIFSRLFVLAFFWGRGLAKLLPPLSQKYLPLWNSFRNWILKALKPNKVCHFYLDFLSQSKSYGHFFAEQDGDNPPLEEHPQHDVIGTFWCSSQ